MTTMASKVVASQAQVK
jgi:hypothetical protein